MSALANIEPKKVWEIFEGLCGVPHPSKKEERIVAHIENWAKQNGFETQKDKIGNLVVRKPATPGMEDRLPICIQGHVDMVTVKNTDTVFDFDNDAIQPYIDGDWVKAKGTTLGADNGIGVAMGMALMEDKNSVHPDLELLCTLDEETGLTGAVELGKDLLKAKVMINLDSEEWGHFTIGCAGGCDVQAHFKYEAKPECNCEDGNRVIQKLIVKGLKGGHSGIEINDGRANAIKVMTRLIYNLIKKYDIGLASINGGDKHNAIPHEAFAIIGIDKNDVEDMKKYVEEYFAIVKREYSKKEPNMQIFVEAGETPKKCMTKEFRDRLINSFYAMPHGVFHWSPDMPGFPQTSLNFAIVETHEDEVFVLTSQRSSLETEKRDISEVVKTVLEMGGATAEIGGGYPAWPPNTDSKILEIGKELYKEVYGKDAVIEAIHAGLECGIVGDKYPGMDMISFGPNLEEVHTPNERVEISSTEKCYDLLCKLVTRIPKK